MEERIAALEAELAALKEVVGDIARDLQTLAGDVEGDATGAQGQS